MNLCVCHRTPNQLLQRPPPRAHWIVVEFLLQARADLETKDKVSFSMCAYIAIFELQRLRTTSNAIPRRGRIKIMPVSLEAEDVVPSFVI